jgi:Tol biopolymer transport system component
MDANGTDPRLVANTEGRGTAPRWSPDGNTIYFTNCVAKDYGTDCEVLMARLEPHPLAVPERQRTERFTPARTDRWELARPGDFARATEARQPNLAGGPP